MGRGGLYLSLTIEVHNLQFGFSQRQFKFLDSAMQLHCICLVLDGCSASLQRLNMLLELPHSPILHRGSCVGLLQFRLQAVALCVCLGQRGPIQVLHEPVFVF